MSTSVPVPVAESAQPTFVRAVSGLWLLTWRRRLAWRQLPILLATVLAIPVLAGLAAFGRTGQPAMFFQWVVVFFLQVALPLYCLAVLGDVIRGELQANTLVFLATRPLSRARLFLVKFLCELAWVELLGVATTMLLLAVGVALGVSQTLAMTPWLLGTTALAAVAYGALSALMGMVHRRFLVLGAIYGLVVEVGIGQIPTNINNLSINRHLRTLLANLAPFQDTYGWSPEGTLTSVLVLAMAPVVLAGLAAALFTWREYHYSEEMHK